MQKKILVVEDNPDALEMLSFILTGEGFSVITAEDGLQALDLVKTHQPDLIVTDVNLPNFDGIELINRLRKEFHSSTLPIVVLSAVGSEILSDAVNAGANGVIQKPMQIDSLLTLIKQVLS